MAEAFWEFACIDLELCIEQEGLEEAGREKGLRFGPEYTWEQVFNVIFLSLVEPHLPEDSPLVLTNYPARVACLAKRIPGTPWAERWELYAKGLELANCFTEETDPDTVRAFFLSENEKTPPEKRHALAEYFPTLFSHGFPDCSGVALGVDRLIMALYGIKSIQEVIPFSFARWNEDWRS